MLASSNAISIGNPHCKHVLPITQHGGFLSSSLQCTHHGYFSASCRPHTQRSLPVCLPRGNHFDLWVPMQLAEFKGSIFEQPKFLIFVTDNTCVYDKTNYYQDWYGQSSPYVLETKGHCASITSSGERDDTQIAVTCCFQHQNRGPSKGKWHKRKETE